MIMSNLTEQLAVFFQSILPQHAVSRLAGKLADCRTPWLKNKIIHWFIKKYHVDLSSALRKQPDDYQSFNDFFTRQLDMRLRPLAEGVNTITSPVDGTVSQAGKITGEVLLQAKSHYFNLTSLLANDTALLQTFYDGEFATFYLAPHDYHRVHMPLTGKLVKTIYVPGKLFSVNRMTSELVPQLYSRNERLICLFDTNAGQFAVIFVGALIVGSIQTRWMSAPVRQYQIQTTHFENGMEIKKGEELGFFSMGSTIILLFPKNAAHWEPTLKPSTTIQVGKLIGTFGEEQG